MNHDRLKFLMEAGAQRRLTDAEEAELARLLEDPAHRKILDEALRPLKARFGPVLDYHVAKSATEPQIPAARLEALMTGVTGQASAAGAKRRRARRWIGPVAAAAALAACLALVFGPERSPDPPGRDRTGIAAQASARLQAKFQLGIIATVGAMRGEADKKSAALGADWGLIPLENLTALRTWAAADLPAGVSARVWIDEEAGLLKAVYRRSDGTIARSERLVDAKTALETQLKLFSAEFASGR